MHKPFTTVFLLISLLFLHACSPQPRTELPPMQATKDESEVNLEEKRELGRPAEFFANGGNKAENATSVILGQYCWSESGESCSVETDDPQDMLADSITGRVKPGGQFSFSIAINPSWTWLSENGLDSWQGTQVDISQIFQGSETYYKNVGDRFEAPEEPGLYYLPGNRDVGLGSKRSDELCFCIFSVTGKLEKHRKHRAHE